jgi:predicted HAD superfamily Cof-like phosphohydrolase
MTFNFMTSLEQVKELHERMGHPVNDSPNANQDSIVDIERFNLERLRTLLLQEELQELKEALDVGDNVDILDALCDLQVVLDGAFLALGFWRVKDEAMAEVHRSNMSKLGIDGKPILREDGKFLKGPNYFPPSLKPIIEKLYAKETRTET